MDGGLHLVFDMDHSAFYCVCGFSIFISYSCGFSLRFPLTAKDMHVSRKATDLKLETDEHSVEVVVLSCLSYR